MKRASCLSTAAGRRIGPVASLVAAGVCALLAAGCSPAMPGSPAGQRPAPGPAAAGSASPADPGYRAARQQWIAEGLVVSSAAQNPPLDLAVTDLQHGEVTDAAGRSASRRLSLPSRISSRSPSPAPRPPSAAAPPRIWRRSAGSSASPRSARAALSPAPRRAPQPRNGTPRRMTAPQGSQQDRCRTPSRT
jgi:hypothetical protein